MPLVPLDTVRAWYRKDSWVYKHFAYLFVNPLWQNRVPNGFSLCPLFWSALFSLFVLRPFVIGVLIMRMVIRVLRLNKVVDWTDRQVNRVMATAVDEIPGAPTLLGLFLLAIGIVALVAIGKGIYESYDIALFIYAEYAAVNALPFLLLPVFLTTMLIACGIYKANIRDNRCMPEVYVRIAAIGSVLIALMIDAPTLFLLVSGPFIAIWYIVCYVGSFLWDFVAICGGGIAFGAKYLLSMVVAAFVIWPFVLGIGALLAGVAWLALRYESLIPMTPQSKQAAPEPEILSLDEVKRIAVGRVAGSVWADLPNAVDDLGSRYAKRSPVVAEWIGKVIDPSWASLDANGIRSKLMDHPEYAAIVNKILIDFRAKEAAEQAVRDARAAKCAAVTGTINRVLTPIGRAIKWPFKQSWVFMCLLWELVKAKKAGACPYLVFSEPVAQTPPVTPKP